MSFSIERSLLMILSKNSCINNNYFYISNNKTKRKGNCRNVFMER